MDRSKNTYRAIINDKFSDLLSANSTKTWPGMKELLDKKMPEKKKRRSLLWFTTKASIIAIVLFALFASAAGVYVASNQKEQENRTAPVQEQQNEIKNSELKNDQPVIKNSSPEEISIKPEKKSTTSSNSAVTKHKGTMQTSDTHTGKTSALHAKKLIPVVQDKDTLPKTLPIINVSVKDSTTITTTEKRRAF